MAAFGAKQGGTTGGKNTGPVRTSTTPKPTTAGKSDVRQGRTSGGTGANPRKPR